MPFKISKPCFDAELVEAIEEYLDLDFQTEMLRVSDPDGDGLQTVHHMGGKGRQQYALCIRPMFQVLPHDHSAFRLTPQEAPCPHCDDWARTSRCETHPERPLGLGVPDGD